MKKIIDLINKSENICILAHESEDADAIGSSYALKLALGRINKKADVYLSEDISNKLSFMGRDYLLFDEKNILKYDLCICLDCADIFRIGKRREIFDKALHTVCIDHHETNCGFADENYIESDAPATGEIIFNLLSVMDIEIDREIARNLYCAISTDTGSFKYSNVRPSTMNICGELLKLDIDHAELSRLLYDTEELNVMKFNGMLMENIMQYADGRLCIVCVRDADLGRLGITERDASDVVNIPRAVKGCEIAVSIREAKDKIKISFRSNGKYSVSDIANHFGGGGHKMASGACQTGKTLDEVLLEVVKVCEEVING